MSDLFVANPGIADVQVRSSNQIFIFGSAPGQTTLYATDRVLTAETRARMLDGVPARLLHAQAYVAAEEARGERQKEERKDGCSHN